MRIHQHIHKLYHMTSKLFEPIQLGNIQLKNRVVMAPLTRSRATSEHIPTEIMATYYAQRAGAGLIITEGTSPSPNGLGYPRIPGIHSNEQLKAWKKVTNAVHTAGSKIFVQLMHTGRIAHPDNMPEGTRILAPSAIAPEHTQMYSDKSGLQAIPTPEAMSNEDIHETINEYVEAAKNAIVAGFDGVELHGANGYLPDQFINPMANQRTDEYGGSAENRIRFFIEIAERVVEAIGADKVGFRISPLGAMNDLGPFDGQEETFTRLAKRLGKLGLTYMHLVDHSSMGAPEVPVHLKQQLKSAFGGPVIISGGYTKERAENDLSENLGELVAFGRPFIANPDLVQRFKADAPLNEPDPETFYTPGEAGYIDYPTLQKAEV